MTGLIERMIHPWLTDATCEINPFAGSLGIRRSKYSEQRKIKRALTGVEKHGFTMYFAAYVAGGIVSKWDVLCSLNVFLKLCWPLLFRRGQFIAGFSRKTRRERAARARIEVRVEKGLSALFEVEQVNSRVWFSLSGVFFFLAPILVKRLLCKWYMHYGYRPLLLTLVVLLLNNVFNQLFYICAEKAVASWGNVSRENIQ